MAGFLWKFTKQSLSASRWRLSISTTRRQYGHGEFVWWDEEIRAVYVNGACAGLPLARYNEDIREGVEKVILVGEVEEGSLIKVLKDASLCKYVLFHNGDVELLAPDFEAPIQKYIQDGLSVNWLLEQEGQG